MIRINLVRESRRSGGGAKPSAAAGGVSSGLQPIHLALIGILLLAAGYVAFKTYTLNSEITRKEDEKLVLEQERQKLQPIIKKKEELERKRAELDRKIGIIKDLKRRQRGPVQLLDQLSRNLPEDVWFDSLSEKDFNITIHGNARNPNKMAEFLDNLKHSGYFASVELHQYTQEAESVKFRLTAKFELPEEEAETKAEAGKS
jgi:type IV pilus assembly protein PilN